MSEPPPSRFTPRPDGRFEVNLDEQDLDNLAVVVADLVDDLDGSPDSADLSRLHPPAYTDNDDRQMEYQLLAGEELRSSRRNGIETSLAILELSVITEEQLWALLRTLNSVRLVTGTRLGIDEDIHHPPKLWFRLPPQTKRLWAVYLFSSELLGEATYALMGD